MINLEPVKKWFGYDRKERRASFILLIIIAVVILVRYIYPNRPDEVEDISALLVRDTIPSSISYGTMMPQKMTLNKQEKTVKKLINLNSCDSAMLEALPGIGPVLSARIIKYRNLIGGYARVGQLREVYGLPQETYDLIKSRVFADTSLLKHVNVNTAEYRDLDQIIYLRRSDIYAIIKYRDINKKVKGLEELVSNKIIADSIARKVKPYLVF